MAADGLLEREYVVKTISTINLVYMEPLPPRTLLSPEFLIQLW
jgi:hypothetical protein